VAYRQGCPLPKGASKLIEFRSAKLGRPPNQPADLWARVAIGGPDECWPWLGSTRGRGYGDFKIGGHHVVAHRLAFELATGTDPGDLLVCHTCDNPPCCNPAHLFLGTVADNNRDKQHKGRQTRLLGSRNPNAKLSEADVREIRRRRAAGEKGRTLAREFEVSPSRITMLTRSRYAVWSHV
jgi:HNH endonuclease